jgi:hypothetical protein
MSSKVIEIFIKTPHLKKPHISFEKSLKSIENVFKFFEKATDF